MSDRKETQIGQNRARADARTRANRRTYPLYAIARLGMMGTRRLMAAALPPYESAVAGPVRLIGAAGRRGRNLAPLALPCSRSGRERGDLLDVSDGSART